MPKKYPGLYLYFDWLRGLDQVPPAVAMEIIRNLWHYAEERREPVPLSKPQYEVIQIFLLEQLKRSVHKSEVNKQNALKRCEIPTDPPKTSFDGMNDEELLEIFRTDESYKDDDPEELLALQHILRKNSGESNQLNA
jgi:hypothetical protein